MKNFYHRSIAISLCLFFFSLFLSAQDVTNNTPGNHTNLVPPNAVSATVEIWGAGGAGGGSNSNNNGGSGGGGGGYTTLTFNVIPNETINYTVGAGGVGTTGTSVNGGGNSTLTYTGANLIANGGAGGIRNGGAGGVGGTASGGTINTSGQAGGAGGGSLSGKGGDGANGGAGGPGVNRDSDGRVGNPPGGGGSGGNYRWFREDRRGGNGANGRVIITYEIALPPTITAYTPNPICIGQTLTITGTNFTGATSVRINGANITPFTVSGTGTAITLVVPASATSGVVRVITPGGAVNGMGSLTVNTPSTAPTSISGNNIICSGDSTTLTRVGGSAGTGANLEWFSGSCGGTPITGTNSITVSPTTTTTYFVRYNGDCNTTTCAQITVTVESPVATAGPISGSATVCQGDATITYSIPVLPNASSYTWTLPSGASVIGTSNSNSITVDYNSSAVSGNISVYGSNVCGDGATATLPITVNPVPTISLTSAVASTNQTLCINTLLVDNIVYAIGGAATNASVSGLPAGITGTYSSGTYTISGTPTVSGTFNYTVTTIGGLCAAVSLSGTITVDAVPTLALTSAVATDAQTLCIFTPITNISYAVGGAATSASAAGLPAGVTGTYAAGVFTISGTPTVPGTFNYTVTSSGSSCTPATITGSIIVNPLPDPAGTITGPTAVCQGNNGMTFTVPSILNATDYIWTLPSGATIASGANTNSIVVDFDITASSGNITVQGLNACGTGAVSTFPITVNITPYIPTNYTIDACSGVLSTLTPANGGGNVIPAGTTYSWGLPTVTGGITGATALSGQTNFDQTLVNPTNIAQTATYSVTAETTGCSASTFTVVVTVHAKPVGAATPASQTVCDGPNNTNITFSETTGISGTITYSWTRTNTTNLNNLPASGNGSSILGTLHNTTADVQTTTFTVIASSQYGCASDPFTVSVSVKPTPTVAATPATQTVCSENNNTSIALSMTTLISGTPSYSWTRTNTTNITGLENGTITTSILAGSLINNTNTVQSTIFTITSIVNGCPSAPTYVTVIVNPQPTVAVNFATQTVCGGTAITPIVIQNPNTLSGVNYSWVHDNNPNLTGIASSGTGHTINGTFVNNSNVDQTAIFTVKVSRGSCFSETTSEVIVKPTPLVVATPATQTLCNGVTITPILLSNTYNIPGTTYSWTRNNTAIVTGIAASGTGSSISGTLTNTGTTTQTVTFTIIATAPNGCSQTIQTTVNLYSDLKDPVIGNSQDVCGNIIFPEPPAPLSQTTPVTGGSGTYNYQWERSTDGFAPWTNATGTSTNATYQPPTGVASFYRLRITDANCSNIVHSNIVFIRYTGIGGVFDSISATNLPGPTCSGSNVNPGVNIDHSLLSDVHFSYYGNSSYISPASGIITNPTVTPVYLFGFIRIGDNSRTNIPLTLQNTTNATVVTQLYVAPIFINGAGSCTAEAIAIPITIRPLPVAEATLADMTFCAGSSPEIAVTGNITDAPMQYSWVRNTITGVGGPTSSGGFSGNVVPGGTYALTNTLSNSTGVPQDITYTITPRSNDCNGAPIYVTVTIAPNVTPGSIAANQTICYGNNPVEFTEVTSATGMNLTYQWQISTTSAIAGFTDIFGATSITYDAPGPVTQDTWYRRIAVSAVNSIVCNSLASNAVRVTINTITPGTTTGDQTICYNTRPARINNVISPTGPGNNSTRTYQWQFTTMGCGADDADWTNITTNGTTANYQPPYLTITTSYRRIVTSSLGDCSVTTDCVTIYVNNVTPGSIADNQTICGDNPDEFTEVTASTGTGVLSYQWQSRTPPSAIWVDITGANSATYDAPPGLTVTTFYRRQTLSTMNGVSCSALSNEVKVTANSVTAGVIEGNRVVCYGGAAPAAFTVPTAATGSGLTYQWQSASAAAGPYTNITGATSATYQAPAGLTETTYYRRVTTGTGSGAGCSLESNFVTVLINNINASVISGDQIVCNNQDPDAFTVATAASGSGTLSYQWQSSTTSTSGPWTNINLATAATYNPPVLAQTTYYQVIVRSTVNGVVCSEVSNPLTVTVTPFVAAVASNTTPIVDCSNTTIVLSGNLTGTWSAVSVPSGSSFSFSDVNDPDASFTGQSGVNYNITWTVNGPSPCDDDDVTFQVRFPNCEDFIDFDGTDDYVNVGNKYNLSSNFTVELWLKRDTNTNSTETLMSKRDGNDTSTGYDLSIVNGQINFRYGSADVIQIPYTLTNSRWYQVAVTYTSGSYTLYVDGINLASVSGASAPTTNNSNYLLGANSQVGTVPHDFFNGSMDEVKIWNTALSQAQIRETMNQEIRQAGTNVQGVVLGSNVAGLNWSNLVGYYQMNQASDVLAGQLADNSGGSNVGSLQNMTSFQAETAPIPYISAQNGNWSAQNTWTNGNVQLIPNSIGIDGATSIDWNIVRTSHNLTATNLDLTVLGLMVDANTLTIQDSNPIDGRSLTVTQYLKIDGILDLEGESQLMQPTGSIVDNTGTGVLHRDQQGTTNHFNYNYWSSPVSDNGLTYQIGSVLYDGNLPVLWTTAHNAIGTTTPVTMSSRWLYLYENYPYNSYVDWHKINQTYNVNVGLGFLMKGSAKAASEQNYTFVGKPNNGTITHTISGNREALIGNPYPSALDAIAFINENDAILSDGTLRFWEQAPSNNSHVTANYLGGYAYYNLLEHGVAAVSPPEIAGSADATKVPQRYIPVGQGFMVTANATGGAVVFNNDQRSFQKELDGNSIFLRQDSDNNSDSNSANQLIEIDFFTPENAVRHLLLGFTPDIATEGIDYGYDAINNEYVPNDMSFAIEGEKFIIQGVGTFNNENTYPLIIDLATGGQVGIALKDLINFDEAIDVYVYDSLLGTYHPINDTKFVINLEAGTYDGRFFLTFQEDQTLSNIDNDFKDITVKYLQGTNEIYISTPGSINVKQVYMINIAGQVVKAWNSTNTTISHEMKIPVKDVSEGNYIIKIQTDTNNFNKKIIVKYK